MGWDPEGLLSERRLQDGGLRRIRSSLGGRASLSVSLQKPLRGSGSRKGDGWGHCSSGDTWPAEGVRGLEVSAAGLSHPTSADGEQGRSSAS